MSSTRRTDTPARCISISASSTELSRRRYRSMMAVSNVCWRSFGTLNRTSPALVQAALVGSGSGIPTCLAALIALRIAQPIRLGIQQCVQRLFHGTPHDPVEMAFDPLVVNRDDIVQRTRCIV